MHWYRYEDRGKAVARFMTAIPVSNMIGAVIAAFLMRITWFGYAGWRWLLVLEGLPAIVAGIVTLRYLTDRPENATWLAENERRWISDELGPRDNSLTPAESCCIAATLGGCYSR